MTFSINKTEFKTLAKLLYEPEPFLTVQKLNNIAFECGTSYNEIIHYIQECRNNNISMHQCIVNIVKKVRPELLG